MEELKKYIRDVPDFPKEGIVFKDITTLLKDPHAFGRSIDLLSSALDNKSYDALVGIESRGFIFASSLAYKLGKGLIPVRRPGKLPADVVQVTYQI